MRLAAKILVMRLAIGAAAGAFVGPVIAVQTGHLMSDRMLAGATTDAAVTAFVDVCHDRALSLWTRQGHQPDDLRGWANPDRERLAEKVAAWPRDDVTRAIVRRACEGRLRPDAD